MAREINLVPDIKNDMIKALKLRNYIFFISILVAAISVGVTVVFGLIAGGQQLALNSKKESIEHLSKKVAEYGDLKDFLTIKDQVGNLATLTGDKKVLSRTFNILNALLPTGSDTIRISELNVDLSGDAPVFQFDAQANAGQEPFIDYNVLDAFKKSMQYMTYDYGNYVDADGNTIPAYCMIETGNDGALFRDSSKGIYAFWTINAEGCNPSAQQSNDQDNSESSVSYATENYDGQEVVRIWRTPQAAEWYKASETKDEPYMSLDGDIRNVPHFDSSCTKYIGSLNAAGEAVWNEQNDNCKLVPAGEGGINISDSSNGLDETNNLVLRFSASITFDPAVFSFNNKHMLALAPVGRRNVTDSYVQLQAMFGERASDCNANDANCNNTQNARPSNNSNNSNNSNDNTNNSTNNNSTNNNTNTNGGNQNG